jgi:hypothetical protein
MKIYRTKLSEVKKLIEQAEPPDGKFGRDLLARRDKLNAYDNSEDEEMDAKMEAEGPDILASEVVRKVQKIMVDLSTKLSDLDEKTINAVVEYLDRELGEKVVSMMW